MISSILGMLFTPFMAVFFAITFAICLFLLIKKKADKTALLIIISLCCIYFFFVLYLSIGFGKAPPPAAAPVMPK